MPRYRVKPGFTLPHHGVVLKEGEELEIPAHVAADDLIRYRVEPVDDTVAAAAPEVDTPEPAAASQESSPTSEETAAPDSAKKTAGARARDARRPSTSAPEPAAASQESGT